MTATELMAPNPENAWYKLTSVRWGSRPEMWRFVPSSGTPPARLGMTAAAAAGAGGWYTGAGAG
eukprot:CAMPEP_0174376540 /NCGR_PEP_ID=MMETSP0811_2-20130205/118521_1 /TAXON_ID=73025 ORGANISM="Eutreptiella gymnastica-like, Strain CCMP1594" /NCGR_SAMPLE_ID=MMETSP0811_2 /ASSEMBLY_ACC=CAM_ASM_000667 /LENGTH=63 /DNA_ID=CAMNT_0015527803 /DNA_START=276 /DNA_END=464 /DNA_ORIENTATION=-